MSLRKKNTQGLLLCPWSKIRVGKTATIIIVLLTITFFYILFEIYSPLNPNSNETITYAVQKGWGDSEIAKDLKKTGLIRSSFFFRFYVFMSLEHLNLQAGKYNLSPRMSIHQIAKKIADGDVIKNQVIILEGWDVEDIGKRLEAKGICKQPEFVSLAKRDYSNAYDFLKGKPKDVSLEGYIFPDTYEVSEGDNCEDIINIALANFDKKLTQELRDETIKQKKTIFEIVTMASMLEKEVKSLKDKKIVSGILWKRIDAGMPLQIDATVNYITGKNDPGVAIKDTKIDSPYNTYKYKGLPKGPISNPGIESIVAALYPTKSPYWFYLSDGVTIFSKTAEEHAANKAKYLE